MTSSSPVLRLDGVGVCYKRRGSLLGTRRHLWGLQNVSLTLHHGETLGVIGANGAGKSTLLRLLADIVRPDHGLVERGDHRVALLGLQVGFTPHLSGRENVVLSGLLQGMNRREIDTKMQSIIDFAELGEFIDEPIQTYSAGMRARLGFAIAFHVDPDIILVDEVLGVGDAEFVRKSTAVMRERIRSDKTVVLVSHNMAEIRRLCDRVVWLDRGHSLRDGPTDQVVDAYEAFLRQRDRPAAAAGA